MRTTLRLDDDVLAAARELAGRQGRSVGAVISDLARQGLRRHMAQTTRNGIPLLPTRAGGRVTMELVNRLRDEGESLTEPLTAT